MLVFPSEIVYLDSDIDIDQTLRVLDIWAQHFHRAGDSDSRYQQTAHTTFRCRCHCSSVPMLNARTCLDGF